MRALSLTILVIGGCLLPAATRAEAPTSSRLLAPSGVVQEAPSWDQPVRLPEPSQALKDTRSYFAPTPSPVQLTDYTVGAQPSEIVSGPACGDPLAGCDQPACASRYIEVDGLVWHRLGIGRSQVLAVNTNPVPDVDVLNTSDVDFGVTGGPRILVGWVPGCCSKCCAWELSYFGLYGWNASAEAVGNNNLAIPGALGANSNNFLNADLIRATYTSNFHNVELNCIKSCCTCDGSIDRLYGLRFINLNEHFSLVSDDSVDEGISGYEIDANNCLYGAQIGVRYNRCSCDWSLQYIAKAAIFLNDANQSQQILDSPVVNGVPFQLRPLVGATGLSVAGLGEVGIVASRPINECWSFRLGYNALVLGGVALAPNQLDFSLAGGDTLDHSGWVLMHGGFAGVETTW
jgi:hypothetical protein